MEKESSEVQGMREETEKLEAMKRQQAEGKGKEIHMWM